VSAKFAAIEEDERMETTDLAQHIQATRMIDTHEHLRSEATYLANGPDVLQDLFSHYIQGDLVVAGATPESVARLTDTDDPDVAARFVGVREAWERCRHTGYGEAARLSARLVYGIEEITAEALEAAHDRNIALRQPGERLRLLRDVARLDHVQIDDLSVGDWQYPVDATAPDFFLYDLSWREFCAGEFVAEKVFTATGVEVVGRESLRRAMATLFDRQGGRAVAVKSQHAYGRTLRWRERSDAEVEPVLQRHLAGQTLTDEERLCLGDWCWARGVELAIEHHLPFKLHTGFYAGYGNMPIDRVRAGHLTPLLTRYPQARFVLMHIAYPYSDELVAIAKHYPNVWVDLCWAWSIDPRASADFVRRMIHAVPSNKLFAFGGDTNWATAAVGYAAQARLWLTRALQAEVDEGLLTEREAIALATRLMRTNQGECFDLPGVRAAMHRAAPVIASPA